MPEKGWSQSNEPWNAKQTKHIKIHQSRITNHELFELVQVNMCFLNPKRSAKMIDGTEKTKICKMHGAIQWISLWYVDKYWMDVYL